MHLPAVASARPLHSPGHARSTRHLGVVRTSLAAWEALACDAVGNAIEFWGFKRNQGRLWALLYLRDTPLSASELQRLLRLSKGAVSMLTHELEHWDVVTRVRTNDPSQWYFEANTDFMAMLRRVLEEREMRFVSRVTADLETALREARAAGNVPESVRDRLQRMLGLGRRVQQAIELFLRSARFDLRGVIDVLRRGLGSAGA
jgi:HTH-type transcriptional regulator, glycine betaine synthesis regulator